MQQTNLNERRYSERILLSAPQELYAEGEENLYLVGLSHNGAEIACMGKPTWNGSVDFCLSLPQKLYTISVSGKIVWKKKKNKWHAGLKFVSLSEVDKQILEAYVDYLQRDKQLQQIRKSLYMNLEQLKEKLDRLLAIIAFMTEAGKETVIEPRPRYLH
ncbi:MAG: PilZ domain-containing protein [Deltaproteobacteria bacterium]|nr:PilZ domain-containing protein [Deltaproteobacteria bacterium]